MRLCRWLFLLLLLLCFSCCAAAELADTLVLPEKLSTIQPEAFAGTDSLDVVLVPEGTRRIESRAFADSSIQKIVLPESLTFIEEDAFEGSTPLMHVYLGSYAHTWAEEHGFSVLFWESSPSFFTYELSDNTVAITGYTGESPFVVLPETIEGRKVISIDENAFRRNKTLRMIAFNPSLQNVEQFAFSECNGLVDVCFNDQLTFIGENAFFNCTSLLEADLPNSVYSINNSAFQGCRSLASFNYPLNWTQINSHRPEDWYGNIFKDCESLTEITVPEGVSTIHTSFFAHSNYLKKINLPSTLTSIEHKAFFDCPAMPSIDIPDSVSYIGSMAFSKNTFTSVTLPSELIELDSLAFSNCANLVDVVFNSKLESIGESAFTNCTSLLEADLPDSVFSINNSAFQGCKSLVSFDYPLHWTQINGHRPEDWYGNIFKGCESLTEITVPEGVTTIHASFFAHSNYLQTINLPSTLTSIEHKAFWDCPAMPSIDIPDSVAYIGSMAFSNNTFTSVTLPSELVELDSLAFSNCANLVDVVFNSKLESIGESAFINCTSLLEADLPDSVFSINNSAFQGCKSLVSFDYPLNWTQINSYRPEDWYGNIFKGCESLTEITIPEGVTTIHASFFAHSNYLQAINLPSTLTSIEHKAFWNCPAMPSIDIPDSVTYIGSMAFSNNTFTSVTLPSELIELDSLAFSNCANLVDVVFNSKLESIGESAFTNCTSLLEADLPDSVFSINNSAFQGCKSLVSFDYPLNWTQINSYRPEDWYGNIFKGCESLTEITIPEGVTTIHASFFAHSNYLQTINLPSTLTSIEQRAFWDCPAMPSIDIPDSVTYIGSMAFSNNSFTSVTLPNELIELDSLAFSNCTNLVDVVFNNKLERVGESAFSNCTSLLEANLPDSVAYINNSAFQNCKSLKAFHYPASWTKINDFRPEDWYGGIFRGCESLEEITVPEGVTELFPRIFRSCDKLVDIQLPSTLRTISNHALSGCPELGDIYIAPRVSSIDDYAFYGWKNLRIFCEWGTVALSHAKAKNIPYYYLSATGATTLNGFHIPSGTIYKGDPEAMHGYVRSSIAIDTITATLTQKDGTVVNAVTIHPERNVYNTIGYLSEQFEFGELPLGSYHFTLVASTAETTETLADTSFTVSPPPLRVTLRNRNLPRGYLQAGAVWNIAGQVVSNYPITRLNVAVYKNGSLTPALQFLPSPQTYTYDLTNAVLELNTLDAGQYTFIVSVQANGEEKQVASSEFIISDIKLPEGTEIDYEAFNAFVANERNQTIFNRYTVNYKSDVVNSLDENGKFVLGMYSKDDQIINDIIDGLELLLENDTSETKLVQLYKKEIASFITSIGSIEGSYTYDKTIAQKVSESFIKFGKIETKFLKEQCEGISEAACEFFESLNGLFEEVGDASETTENIVKLAVFLSEIAEDYTSGIAVLQAMEAELNSKRMSYEFQLALRDMEYEYTYRSYRAVSKVFTAAKKKFAEASTELFSDCLLLMFGSEIYVTYKVLDLAWDTITECTGLYDEAKAIEQYFVQVETFSNANAAYQKNFKAVHEGDTSEEAVAKLILSFDVTRSAAVRALETLRNLNASNVNDTYVEIDLNALKKLEIK